MSVQQQLPNQCKSEVALLLERIDLEYTAACRGLNGLSSGSSQHEVITAKMEHMSDAVEELKKHVGNDEAMALTIEIMNRADGEGTDSREKQASNGGC